ncbi:MAG: cell division protein FtsB [Castellaniella sp.]
MRLLFLLLLALTLAIQYPLWWGKGGWGQVAALKLRLERQKNTNDALKARNNALAAEVQDLKDGTQAIEERARLEQGMLRDGEVFVQILPDGVQEQHSTGPQAGSNASRSGSP